MTPAFLSPQPFPIFLAPAFGHTWQSDDQQFSPWNVLAAATARIGQRYCRSAMAMSTTEFEFSSLRHGQDATPDGRCSERFVCVIVSDGCHTLIEGLKTSCQTALLFTAVIGETRSNDA